MCLDRTCTSWAQVTKFDDPQEACFSVVAESYRLWLQHETRTDDITMLVIQLQARRRGGGRGGEAGGFERGGPACTLAVQGVVHGVFSWPGVWQGSNGNDKLGAAAPLVVQLPWRCGAGGRSHACAWCGPLRACWAV